MKAGWRAVNESNPAELCIHAHQTMGAAFRCARKTFGLRAKDQARCTYVEATIRQATQATD